MLDFPKSRGWGVVAGTQWRDETHLPLSDCPNFPPRGHLGRVCWLAWTAEIKALSAPGWACRGAGGQQPMGFAVSKQSATCIHGTHYPPLRGGPRAGGSEFHGLSYGPRRVGRWGWGRASGPPGWLPGITTTHMRGCGGGGARLPSRRALKDGQSCLYSKPPPAQAPSEG